MICRIFTRGFALRSWGVRSAAFTLAALLVTQVGFAQSVAVEDKKPSADTQEVLERYADRLPHLEKQIPAIVRAAEAAAERRLENRSARLIFGGPKPHNWFLREFLRRAGGLANSNYRIKRGLNFNPGDIIILGAADWEEQGDVFRETIPEYKAKDCLVILFGPEENRPSDLPIDFLVDTGTGDDSEMTRHVNAISALTLGWMWCTEYAAALSRKGKNTGILQTKAYVEGGVHNDPLQTEEGMNWLGDTDKAVEAGKLSNAYMKRIEKLVSDLRSEALQTQLDNAADLIVERLESGKKVYISSAGHAVPHEMLRHDGQAPWSYVYRSDLPRDKFLESVEEGELLVWIGYMGHVGLKRRDTDVREVLRDKGVDMIVSEAALPPRDSKPEVDWPIFPEPLDESPVIATVEQHWSLPDAEVELPWSPGYMAPVSGINADLIYRMLDEEVVQRLNKKINR